MQQSAKTPQFLSLRWKTFIATAVLLALIFGLLFWHLNNRYQHNFADTLSQLRLQNIDTVERHIHRSGVALQQKLASYTNVYSTGDFATSSFSQQLGSNLNTIAVNLSEQDGISQLLLLDRFDQVQARWQDDENLPLPIDTLIAVSNPNLSASSLLTCQAVCVQVVKRTLFENGAKEASLIAVRPFKYLRQQIEGYKPTYLGIIELQNRTPANQEAESANKVTTDLTDAGLTDANVADPNNENLLIPGWQARLLTPTGSRDIEDVLLLAAEGFSHVDLSDKSEKIQLADSFYSVGILPIRSSSNQNIRFVILNDVTARHQSIVQNLVQDSVVMFSLLLLLGIYFAIASWKYLRRINQQLKVLPMLGQKQYHEVRNLIGQNRSHSLYHDEFDNLDNSVTALTYQLESLEKAVNHRTREMERLSLFDTLTGLANRNLFLYDLQRDVQRFQQQGGMLAVIILDLDKFKRINDTLGHQLGDMLLSKIGSRLRTATRTFGLVSRMGGDEFALILRSAKKFSQIEVTCQKILDLVHKPITLNEQTLVSSCSLGISLAGKDLSANDLVKNAEIAMYKAKQAGGNTFRMFNSAMATETRVTLTLEAEIRRALANKEFTLYLQPKVNMDSEIEGFESLVRWDHPDRGMVAPGEFIPAMENMGLINQLDNFILDSSCRQLKVLNQHFPGISIAVNISSIHFTDKNFLTYLKGCLQRYPIDPGCLELEITETLLMENMDVGMEIMQQIKELGVSIAIDDFGTGYSSLSYLKKLPVDTIKIDREFIKDIPDSESDMQISSVIIFLAKQLNFKVVAEGVETSEQLVFLKANHCDLAQGFYFSKPIPAHKAMLLLESQRREKKLNVKQG